MPATTALRRTVSVARKEFLHMLRDTGTLFFAQPGEARGQVALFLGLTMLPFAIVAPLIGTPESLTTRPRSSACARETDAGISSRDRTTISAVRRDRVMVQV